MNKIIFLLAIIIIFLFGIYYFTIQGKKTTNLDQNLKKEIINKVDLEKEFTLEKNKTTRLGNYDINLKLLDLIQDPSSQGIAAVIYLFGSEVLDDKIILSQSFNQVYYDTSQLRIIFKKATLEKATFLVQKLFLSEDDYFCIKRIDCMPIVSPENIRFCDPSYIKWAQKNCPGFGVTY